MQLQDVNKDQYLKLSRMVSVVLIICFASSAMISGQVLVHTMGNPEGGNFYLNLAGVIVGVLITSLVFSFFRNDPRLADLLYVFRLKRMLARITNRMHHIKQLSQEEHETACIILRFYYQGLLQVYHLESNEYGYKELEQEQDSFLASVPEHVKVQPLPDMQPELIESTAKLAGK